jgi:hypothetical protein
VNIYKWLGRAIFVPVLFILFACSGGSGGGGAPVDNPTDGNNGGDDDPASSEPGVTFNLKGANAVLVYDEPIATDDAGLPKSRHQSQGKAERVAAANAEEPGNLLALNKTGDLSIAIKTRTSSSSGREEPRVNYTVPSPDGRYLYVIMKNGAYVKEDVPLESRVWEDCYLFKVDVATNEWSCLPAVGFANRDGPDYSGFGQAVQFDGRGNAYVTGCVPPPPPENGTYASEGYYSCGSRIDEDKNLDVYRETEDGSLESLNVFQNDELLNKVHITKSGDVVYKTYKEGSEEIIRFWRNTEDGGRELLISSNSYDPHHVDDSDTIYRLVHTGYFDLPVPVFMKPSSGGELTLNRFLLGPQPGELSNGAYRGHLITADDGRLFLFTRDYFGDQVPDEDDGRQLWQLLPRTKMVSADIELNDARLIANLFVRVSEKETGNHGVIDRINIMSLDGTSKQFLFDVTSDEISADPNLPFYDIYNLVFDGRMAYFSALDLSRSVSVVGAIDFDACNAVADDKKIELMDNYLEITDVGSTRAASSRLRDVKNLNAPAAGDGGVSPIVQSIDFHSDNPYSVSITFSKPMDQESVEEHLTLMGDGGAPVPYMPLWLSNRLHLLIDRNNFDNPPLENGLPDNVPLQSGQTYTIQINQGASDRAGNPLANTDRQDLRATVTIN